MSHSLPYEVNCSILFTELPLLERAAAAKDIDATIGIGERLGCR